MVRSISETVEEARKLVSSGSQEMEMITAWDRMKADVLSELWLRQLLPDQGFTCRSGNLTLCEQMGAMGIWGIPSWGTYLMYLVVALTSAITRGLSVNRLTRG